MLEIRIHGRGGQGVKKSAMVLARAFYLGGYKTQDFAIYGAERRGAPVISFVRIDKKEINTRGYIFWPDYILILDPTLDIKDCLKGAKKNTGVFINSTLKIGNYNTIDATGVAIEEIGIALGANIVLISAFVKHFKKIDFTALEKAIKIELKKYPPEVLNKNIRAAKRGYES